MFQGDFRVLQGNFKGVSIKSKGDSSKTEGCFNGVLSGIQRCLQEF